MGRKRSKSTGSPFGDFIVDLFIIAYYLCFFLVYILYHLIFFIVNIIIFYCSGYKQKSGNGFFKTYFDKGLTGEYKLYRRAIKFFGKENVLVNVYLPCSTSDIDNTEIDVVAVSNKSIYCFEMKNYKGHIYGKEYDKYWTQVFNRRKKYTFYNPVLQNKAHFNALHDFLQVDYNLIYPLIVFGNKSNLDNVRYCLSDSCYLKEVSRFIKRRENDSKYCFDDDVRKEFVDKLSLRTLVSEIEKEKHIEQVNRKYNRK